MSYAHYIASIPFCPLVFPFPAYHQGKKHQKQGEKGQKQKYICLLLCFVGKIGDKKGRNLNIFLKARKEGGVLRWSAACLHRVHLGRWSGNSCYFADVSKIGQDSAGRSAFVLLIACLWCVAHKYAFVSRFKGVFRGFPLLDVGLYCLRASRGLWGFVRVWS